MTGIHDDLVTVLDAVTILSSTGYTLNGEAREVPPGSSSAGVFDAEPGGIVLALAEGLYRRLYTRPTARSFSRRSDGLVRRDFMVELSAANVGRGTCESGWSVGRIDDDGQVFVIRDGVAFCAAAAQLRRDAGQIQPNAGCRVRIGKEFRWLVPGFYVAVGDAEGDTDFGPAEKTAPLVRCYWHLKRDIVGQFVLTATSLLNAAQVPFRLKVLNDPYDYHRADAGVLYLERGNGCRIGAVVAQIYAKISAGLRPETPLFTRRLADGLGLADDPGGKLSFGQHRCQLVAQALWDSFINGDCGREARAAAMIAAFLRAGLDPARPHLAPRSTDDDCLVQFPEEGARGALEASERMSTSAGSLVRTNREVRPALVAAAVRIGKHLCESACWDIEDEVCNWMGRSSREVSGWTGPIRATSAALGLDVYAGSAGIALFLAQLHALTGDTWALKTSLGAIRRSIRLLDRAPATQDLSPLSFYCGHLGIAFVARRVGTMTGVDKLIRQADSMFKSMARATSSDHVLDLIGGNAGAIPALLTLGHSCGLETLRDLAIDLGDELLRAAVRERASCYWPPDLASGPGTGAAPLTGLSHGASGIGLALFELYALTGRLEFLETARGAFAYEDSLFDANEGNWPDLRFSADQTHFARLWCHGAPGIALTRLRAATLDPDRAKNYVEFARIALATTIRAIEENLAEPRPDASLCHGMAGLGEVCLFASQALNDPSYREVANSLADELISRYAATGDWPSGAPSGGPNPSLMLGLAGIGYWFLRLYDMEQVASILLVTPGAIDSP